MENKEGASRTRRPYGAQSEFSNDSVYPAIAPLGQVDHNFEFEFAGAGGSPR